MRKIKDRIILGMVSGILAGKIAEYSNVLQYKWGLTDVSYALAASKLFIPKSKVNSTQAQILSSMVNGVNEGIAGTMIAYFLTLTGRDRAVLKSTGLGCMLWVLLNGLVYSVGLRIKTQKPLTPMLSFLDHVLFGSLCGFLVSRLGDDSLFPDKTIREQDEIPIVYTGKYEENNN